MAKDINNDNSFLIRLRSSVILMIITIASMLLGGEVLFFVLAAITVKGLTELYRVVDVSRTFAGIVGYIAAIAWYALVYFDKTEHMALFTGAFLVVLLAVYVLTFPKYNSEKITMVFFGLFYVAITLSYIYRLRIGAGGAYTVWLVFISSWGSDTCAYLVGRKIGKHKIAPKLSPKKSLEGCIGGMVGAALLGFVYATIFKGQLGDIAAPQLVFAVIGAAGSVVSQIGDMAASAIKRDKGIKDYGRLIPGHGGILDRFDSVIFIAPIVYYLLQFLG